jgi:hypothetical protein
MRTDLSNRMVSVALSSPPCGRVPHQRLVVAALGLPLLDRFGRHPLGAQLHARHVVRRIDDEEQQEGDQVDPDQDRDGVQQATDDVSEHGLVPARLRQRQRRGLAALLLDETEAEVTGAQQQAPA